MRGIATRIREEWQIEDSSKEDPQEQQDQRPEEEFSHNPFVCWDDDDDEGGSGEYVKCPNCGARVLIPDGCDGTDCDRCKRLVER